MPVCLIHLSQMYKTTILMEQVIPRTCTKKGASPVLSVGEILLGQIGAREDNIIVSDEHLEMLHPCEKNPGPAGTRGPVVYLKTGSSRSIGRAGTGPPPA